MKASKKLEMEKGNQVRLALSVHTTPGVEKEM